MKRSIFIFALAAVLALTMTGCEQMGKMASDAASKAGEAVSKLGEDVSDMGSRVASDVDSAMPGVNEPSSAMGDSSTVDSGTDGFIGDDDDEDRDLDSSMPTFDDVEEAHEKLPDDLVEDGMAPASSAVEE